MAGIVMMFKTDGTVEIKGEEGQNAQRNLKWLLDKLGKVERVGHKHEASGEERIQIKQQ